MTADTPSLLDDLITKAKRAGAEAADAILFGSVSLSHAQRLGQLERLEREESQDLGLRVFQGKHQAFVSSTDFAPDALEQLIERAGAMLASVPEDPYCGLAAPEQLAKAIPEIDLLDPEEPTPEALIERAKTCEEAARAVEGITNSEGAEASWGRTEITLVTSEGFSGSYARSGHSLGVAVVAGEGLAMERDYDFSSAVYGSDLEDPEAVGKRAGERTLRRLGPSKPKTGRVPVVFDPRVAGSLLGHLAGAINGSSIARGTSFLKDHMGKQLFAPGITLVDDPHRARGLRSKPFDGEGVANRAMNVVEDGQLTTWILDLSSAMQLGLTTTGHASRGTSGPPGPSTSNFYMTPGTISAEALMADITEGFYVTELMGMSVNGLTGDYSRGAAGFWIQNGEITYPVSEATIAGNLKDIYARLTPADDLVFKYGTNAPTLRVEGMTVAGA
jgi:PmbA protein